MRLSEAIRLGSMLKPKTEGSLWKAGKSCALGAACDALGIRQGNDDDFSTHALGVEFPYLYAAVRCPACRSVQGVWRRLFNEEYDVEDVIIHLNDDHKWTRQRIADWVATIEPQNDVVADPSACAEGERDEKCTTTKG